LLPHKGRSIVQTPLDNTAYLADIRFSSHLQGIDYCPEGIQNGGSII